MTGIDDSGRRTSPEPLNDFPGVTRRQRHGHAGSVSALSRRSFSCASGRSSCSAVPGHRLNQVGTTATRFDGVLRQLPLPIDDARGVQLSMLRQLRERAVLLAQGRHRYLRLERGRVRAAGAARRHHAQSFRLSRYSGLRGHPQGHPISCGQSPVTRRFRPLVATEKHERSISMGMRKHYDRLAKTTVRTPTVLHRLAFVMRSH